MTDIVIGTTPTITFNFSEVNVDDIKVAILTIKRQGRIILEKNLQDATVIDKGIQWVLSQQDTLGIGTGYVEILLNWVKEDGMRGVSKKQEVNFKTNHINEVITNE